MATFFQRPVPIYVKSAADLTPALGFWSNQAANVMGDVNRTNMLQANQWASALQNRDQMQLAAQNAAAENALRERGFWAGQQSAAEKLKFDREKLAADIAASGAYNASKQSSDLLKSLDDMAAAGAPISDIEALAQKLKGDDLAVATAKITGLKAAQDTENKLNAAVNNAILQKQQALLFGTMKAKLKNPDDPVELTKIQTFVNSIPPGDSRLPEVPLQDKVELRKNLAEVMKLGPGDTGFGRPKAFDAGIPPIPEPSAGGGFWSAAARIGADALTGGAATPAWRMWNRPQTAAVLPAPAAVPTPVVPSFDAYQRWKQQNGI